MARKKTTKAWTKQRLQQWVERFSDRFNELVEARGSSGAVAVLKRGGMDVGGEDGNVGSRLQIADDSMTADGSRLHVRVQLSFPYTVSVRDDSQGVSWETVTDEDGPWWDMLADLDPVQKVAAAVDAMQADKEAEAALKEQRRLARVAALRDRYADAEEPGP